MQDMSIQEIIGRECKVIANSNVTMTMFGFHRENHFTLQRNNVKYDISIKAFCNKKDITILLDRDVNIETFYNIVTEIFRFENVFEGRFFKISSFKIDNQEYIKGASKYLLKYFQSNNVFVRIELELTDKEYKKLFLKFTKAVNKNILRYNAYLYAAYSKELTPDLRIAILIQVFEPIAKEMEKSKKIQIVKSNEPKMHTCRYCEKTIPIKEKITLNDCLSALIKNYGKDVFKGDAKAKIIKRTVNLRNRIDHVNPNKKNYLSGGQSGFYIRKYELLFRLITIREIGIEYDKIQKSVCQSINSLNKQYPMLRIMS